MAVAVIVKAIGFNDSERNAFSTVLDLSPSRLCTYRLWTPSTTRQPDIFLLDGENSVNWNEVSNLAKTTDKPFLWVGHNPPRNAAHSFLRPVRWMSVMDALEVVASTIDLGALSVGTDSSAGIEVIEGGSGVDIDLDLGGGGVDIDLDLGFGSDAGDGTAAVGLPEIPSFANSTSAGIATSAGIPVLPSADASMDAVPEPPTLMRTMLFTATAMKPPAAVVNGTDTTSEPVPSASGEKRALLVTNSRYERLFLRARFLKLGIVAVDEVASAKDAMACAQAAAYDVAIVDIDTPGIDGWMLAQELRHAQHPVESVIMTSAKRSAIQAAKAKMAGLALVGGKPIDTVRLDRLLAKVAA